MSVRTTMTLTDRMTGTLQKMMTAMNSTIRAMEQMHTTSNRAGDMRSLQRARRDIDSAGASFERLRASARLAGSEGQNAGNRLSNGLNGIRNGANIATGGVRTLLGSLLGFAGAYLSIQGIANGFSKFTQAADNYSSSNARLNNINDGLQTQAQLQDKIYKASQRSLSSYNDTAASVAKLNLLAKDSFASNDEAIRFTELMNKSFSVSGASTQEKQAGMYQLTQAMGAGRLQGDEFRSIMENAPLLAQAIADATGVGMEGLKKMSSEGTITADVIKSSLFDAAKDIEEKFNNMPLTFADAMTVFNNWAQKAFEPLFIRFRQFVNSDAFGVLAGHAMVFVNLFVSGLSLVFSALETMYNIIGAVGQFMYDNAAWIVPILVVMGVVLGSIIAILITKYAVLGLIRLATLAWAAALWVVDAAFLASPITWVLIAIIAIIALVVMAMIMWAEQTAVVIGFIVGLFAALGAYLYNQIANLWNLYAMFAEFLINLFIDPVYAVKKLFYDLAMMVINNMVAMGGSFDAVANALGQAFVTGANMAITAVNWIIEALKSIPGVDIGKIGKLAVSSGSKVSSGIKNFAANLEAPTSDKNTVSIKRMDLANIPGMFNAGKELGSSASLAGSEKLNGLVDKAKGFMGAGNGNNKENPFTNPSGLMDQVANTPPSAGGLPAAADKNNKLKGGNLDKVGKIDDEINIADEQMEIFKDIATKKSIQNFVTLTPTVQMQTGDINNNVDVNDVVKEVEKAMVEEIARSAEGVYS